jgi:hypothetical protein
MPRHRSGRQQTERRTFVVRERTCKRIGCRGSIEATIEACERFAALLLDEGDPLAVRGLDADHAAQILLRIYQATRDEALQARCLDTIDQLSRLRPYGLDQALAAFER